MVDFDREWKRMDRRASFISMLVLGWVAFVFLLAAAGVGLGIYTLLNPELIGEFAGRVISGFETIR